MRRNINDFKFGWINGKSNLTLNATFIPGGYIKVQPNNKYYYFDIDFNKQALKYIITHQMYLIYPWCSIYERVECGKYITYKGCTIADREESIKNIIVDFFVGMYGSEELLEKHFGDMSAVVKEDCDNWYQRIWDKNYTVTQEAMKRFAEDYGLV